jgi:hypothetical protein
MLASHDNTDNDSNDDQQDQNDDCNAKLDHGISADWSLE